MAAPCRDDAEMGGSFRCSDLPDCAERRDGDRKLACCPVNSWHKRRQQGAAQVAVEVEPEALQQGEVAVQHIAHAAVADGIGFHYFDHLLCEAAGHFAVGSGHEQGAEGIAEVFACFACAAELFAVLPGALEGGAAADLCADVGFQFGEVAIFGLVEGHVVEGALDLEGIVLFCHFGDILMFDKKGTVGRPNYF